MKIQHTKIYGTVEAFIIGKFIASCAYIRKSVRFQTNNLMTHWNVLENYENQYPKNIDWKI